MSEEIKFDLDGDIIMQIEMDSYMKYNGTIASMNDHLGEMYGYSDVKNVEEAQLHYEKELAYKAIKDLQQKAEQLEKENKELNRMCELYGQSLYNADLTKAEKKVEQLENIRKEAIEYVREHPCNTWYYTKETDNTQTFGNREVIRCDTELLNILNKGSDKMTELEIYEEYCKRHPEEITSDFMLEEDGNPYYIDEITEELNELQENS